MEITIDAHLPKQVAGRVSIHRLNCTEYAAAVKSLVGVDVNPEEILPQDISVQGFDTVTALTAPPAFLQLIRHRSP